MMMITHKFFAERSYEKLLKLLGRLHGKAELVVGELFNPAIDVIAAVIRSELKKLYNNLELPAEEVTSSHISGIPRKDIWATMEEFAPTAIALFAKYINRTTSQQLAVDKLRNESTTLIPAQYQFLAKVQEKQDLHRKWRQEKLVIDKPLIKYDGDVSLLSIITILMSNSARASSLL
jgi:hypothetical protein